MTTPTPAPDPGMDPELIRQLAQQIADMTKLGFDPMTIRKGIIAAVDDSVSPPTVSLNISGDTDTLITQVRTLNNYTPLVDQTVLLAKQGMDIFLLGAIAATNPYAVGGAGTSDNGWRQATISNGTHGGNSNGNIYYRRVLDHGSWRMDWRGGWNPAGSTVLIASGQALDTDFRPSSKRSVLAAREIQTGATAVQFDFNTDGTVNLVGGTTAPTGNTTGSGGGFSIGDHSHTSYDYYWNGSANVLQALSTDPAGGFSIGSHTHSTSNTVSAPGWVSLNGVSYYL